MALQYNAREKEIIDALPFDSTKTYNQYDYCRYQNDLYRCIVTIEEAEDFDEDHWELVDFRNLHPGEFQYDEEGNHTGEIFNVLEGEGFVEDYELTLQVAQAAVGDYEGVKAGVEAYLTMVGAPIQALNTLSGDYITLLFGLGNNLETIATSLSSIKINETTINKKVEVYNADATSIMPNASLNMFLIECSSEDEANALKDEYNAQVITEKFSVTTKPPQNFASGKYSHAEGEGTIASSEAQHVEGKFNVEDKDDKYAHIVGGGVSDSARSNIYTLDWNGNGTFSDVYAKMCGFPQLVNLGGTAGHEFFPVEDSEPLGEIFNIAPMDVYMHGVLPKYGYEYIPQALQYVKSIKEDDGVTFEAEDAYFVGCGSLYEILTTYVVPLYNVVDDLFSDSRYIAFEGCSFDGNDVLYEENQGSILYVTSAYVEITIDGGEPIGEDYIPFFYNIQDDRLIIPNFAAGVNNESDITLNSIEIDWDKGVYGIVGGRLSNIAYAQHSHAEGILTVAEGYASHAEGGETGAVGSYSHAEGDTTFAYGYASHAEGQGTQAWGRFSHAEGTSTANSEYCHAEGKACFAGDPGMTMNNYGYDENKTYNKGDVISKHSLWGEMYVCLEDGITGEFDSNKWQYFDVDNSHAEGEQTDAYAKSSHAEGFMTVAAGEHSHAEGYENYAIGKNSHVEGESNYAMGYNSHVEGRYNEVDKDSDYAHVEGYSNKAYGSTSHLEGGHTQSGWSKDDYLEYDETQTYNLDNLCYHNGLYQCKEDNVTGAWDATKWREISDGNCAHAEGSGSIAYADFSHAEGNDTRAFGDDSHAEGYSSKAYGRASHAEGTSRAYGERSHSEGNSCKANGNYSHVEGYYSYANGDRSHAEGDNVYAYGKSSHAEGDHTKAVGNASHVEGSNTIAYNYNTHAEGSGTVIGVDEYDTTKTYAKDDIIKNGEDEHARENFYKCKEDNVTGEWDATKWEQITRYINVKNTPEGAHVQGTYNIKDTQGKYAHIVGNGASEDYRSNAHTLDWQGNAWFAGDVSIDYHQTLMPSGGGDPYDVDYTLSLKKSANLVVGTDLNDIAHGSFWVNAGCLNTPIENVQGTMTEIWHDGGNSTQLFTVVGESHSDDNDGKMFVRTTINGVCGSWSPVGSGGGSSKIKVTGVVDSTDKKKVTFTNNAIGDDKVYAPTFCCSNMAREIVSKSVDGNTITVIYDYEIKSTETCKLLLEEI